MTTTQAAHKMTNPNGIRADMANRAADQSTQALCEAIVILAGMPRSPETNMTRAILLDALCERHPEAEAAAEAWAESDDEADLADFVLGAALTAIGA